MVPLRCHRDLLLGRKLKINKYAGASLVFDGVFPPPQEMYTGLFTEEEFRSLGIMAPFVVDEVFVQLDRSFFTQNLDYLSGLCYRRTKMDIVARLLQEPAAFGYRSEPR